MKPIVQTILALGLAISTASQANAYDIRSGLLSYYPFETSTTDDANYINHFTPFNGPALNTSGAAPRNSALQLNGTSQYLRIDHTADNASTGLPIYRARTYSVTMWVKGPAQSNRYLFTHGSSTSNNPLFLLQTGTTAANNNKFDVYIRADGNGVLLNHVVSTNVVFDDTWHHVAWVDNNGSARLYIDGQLDPANFNYNPAGTYTFDRTAIGALVRSTASGYFNGLIDDVTIWERELSQSEVQQIMNNGVSTPVPALPPLIVQQPVSATKHYQDAVTFSVTAVGTRPNHNLTYQWNQGANPIPGATDRTYRIFNLTPANSGEVYNVTVTAGSESVTSSNATLTVLADGPADLRDGIISYWPLNEVENDGGLYTTIDLYSRNDFILTNMTEYNLEPGQFGNSLLFDNLSFTHAVRSGGAPVYNTNGYSVSMWVKADGSFQGDVRVYAEGSNISDTPLFTIGTMSPVGPEGLAQVLIRSDANRTILARRSTRPVFDGNWHHIVWTDTNGVAKLYVDGVLDETDFTYTPEPLTLNVTALGAVVRKTAVAMIFGNIDEVATWSRPISYTEIQEVKNSSIPAPLAPTAPSFITEPASTNVMTKADVTFSVLVSGTAPFTYQWHKDNSPIANGTEATLLLPSVQLSDAGSYHVTVSNAGGTTNSAAATLNVTTRPAPPTSLAIDFNNRNEVAGHTEAGFQSFTLAGSGAISTVTSQLYGGVEVTVNGSNTTPVDSRRRGSPVNAGDFTQEKLLTDFVFSTPTSGVNGLDVAIKYMEPNQQYTVTLWSFDSQNFGDRISDWYANGVLVKDDYIFEGSAHPTDNQKYQFSFPVTSDANGTVKIEGRREATGVGVSVFLNALKIEIPVTRVTSVESVGGNLRLTIETPDSSKAHTVEETTSLSGISWSGVNGATTTILSDTSLQIEFTPAGGQSRFYRINRAE